MQAHRFSLDSIRALVSKPPVRTWSYALPDTKDHQEHTTEMSFPDLELGYYILFASADSSFRNKEKLDYRLLRVSRLSYLLSADFNTGKLEIFVLDRETGHGIANARLTIFEPFYNAERRSNLS